MLKELPEDEFGPRINIREYSFLDNPSMPKQVTSWDHLMESLTLNFIVNHAIIIAVLAKKKNLRWKIHGLMFNYVKWEAKIVNYQIAQIPKECSDFQSTATKRL